MSEQEVALKVVEIPCPDCKAESLWLIRLERGVHFVCRACDGVYDLATRGIAAVFH